MLLWIPCSPSPLHFCSILGAKGSQRPWAQHRPIGYLPFIPWPRLLSEAWNSCSAGGAGGASRALSASQLLLGAQGVGESWSPPQTGRPAEPGDHLPSRGSWGPLHGSPAQTAVDCLML